MRFAPCALALVALHVSLAWAQEKVEFPSNDADIAGAPTVIAGRLYRPEGAGPFPAVVGLHGCAGMLTRDGASVSPTYAAWAEHLQANGFVVLLVDGFTPRRVTNVCGAPNPEASPDRVRTRDAYGALLHLQAQPFVRPDGVAVMGWSHGGGATLFTVAPVAPARPAALPNGDFRAAVAMYPGWCRVKEHGAQWKPAIPMLALLGGADDWTPPEPCLALLEGARSAGAPIEIGVYPGANHAFDSPAGTRTLESVRLPSGRSPTVGGDPAARADAYRRVVAFLRARLGE